LITSNRNLATWLEVIIRDFVNTSPENSLRNATNDKAWADPLVGFSSGADPLYEYIKEHIGYFYWTPLEIFNKTFPHLSVQADQITVISWTLPHTEETKAGNRRETVYPSERWARARFYGEMTNNELRKHVVQTLQKAGFEAVAPSISPLWETKTSESCGLASTWSERHAAYVSGLGTFGLCDGLITPRGKAMRCGSVIAHVIVPPTKRPYNDRHSYCLFFSKGLCGKCIQRCPAGAITQRGHDKTKCLNHLTPTTAEHVRSYYGFDSYSCGLCQTGVPCESRIPIISSE
jgi:epoxyqueuosine reductase QueG